MTKKRDQTQEFRKFLAQGRSVPEAAACAGIAPQDVETALRDVEKERARDVVPLASVAFSRLMTAIDTLEELAQDAEEERDRISAAKALLDFAVKAQSLRIGADVADKAKDGPSVVLWDFTRT